MKLFNWFRKRPLEVGDVYFSDNPFNRPVEVVEICGDYVKYRFSDDGSDSFTTSMDTSGFRYHYPHSCQQ